MSPPPLLEIDSLRIETSPQHSGPRVLLESLSLQIAANEFVAIVGESGSGKTLAARAILNLLPPGVRVSAGAIRLDGEDLTQLAPARMRAIRGASIGMVFQEPMASLNPALTVGWQLTEALKLHQQLRDDEIRARCLEMLARVRIADPARCFKSYPHEFSGGMRQRIMLASVLLLKPKLLIADEPTTALDTLSQRDVLDLMVELARDGGVATLLITHDLGLVARYAERVVVLEKGRQIETGETAQILLRPMHDYTRRLVGARPHRIRQIDSALPVPPIALRVEKACIAYEGRVRFFGKAPAKQIVHDADLEIREGEMFALVGASGSGKSTLGRAIVGLKALASGRILFDGLDIASLSTPEMQRFRAGVQLIFQDPFSSLDPRMRIRETVGATLRHQPGTRTEHARRVVEVLDQVGLAGFGDRYPHNMSGGQRQRVAIARAIVSRPRLVVADEPVSALDRTIQSQVLALLQQLQTDYGFACLFITHDLSVVEQIANQVAVMSAGCIVERGKPDVVLKNPQHSYTRALLDAAPRLPDPAPEIFPAD